MRAKWLGPVCILAMVIFSIVMYSQLPDQVPVHWDAAGEANGVASRLLAVTIMPGSALILWLLLLSIMPRIDPNRANYPEFEGTRSFIINLAIAMIAFLHVAILGSGAGWGISRTNFIAIGLGLFIALSGNVMGRVRPNWFIGFRNPWTLSDPDVWRRTHRMGGRLMVAAGLLMIVLGIIIPGATPIIVVAPLLVMVLLTSGYSYFVWRQKQDATGGPA